MPPQSPAARECPRDSRLEPARRGRSRRPTRRQKWGGSRDFLVVGRHSGVPQSPDTLPPPPAAPAGTGDQNAEPPRLVCWLRLTKHARLVESTMNRSCSPTSHILSSLASTCHIGLSVELGHQAQLLLALLGVEGHRRHDEGFHPGVAERTQTFAGVVLWSGDGGHVDELVRERLHRRSLLAGEVKVLHLPRGVLEPIRRDEAVVEVLLARAHATDV